MAIDLIQRTRRNRKSESIRSLLQETRLHPSQLVAPLFIIEGSKLEMPIPSLSGHSRLTPDLIIKKVEKLYELGIRAIDLFPVVPKEKKTPNAAEALRPNNLVNETVRLIKKELPEICVMVDVALDPYTSHGHDGIIDDTGYVINDATLPLLTQMSTFAAEAGADVIAPSDMMDGRVAAIRSALDVAGFTNVSILSYAAKYASSFYGPFRDALGSHPPKGNKKGYQMDPANSREALRECLIDVEEGADMLLIKPALAYLDIIAKVKEKTLLPVGAYHVSGEYAMVMAAAEKGWIDADKALMESLIAIRRAGADFIFTYAAERFCKTY